MKRAASELGLSEDRCETFIAEKAVERFESTAWLRVVCTWLVESAPYIVIKNGPFTVLECEPFRALTVIESESLTFIKSGPFTVVGSGPYVVIQSGPLTVIQREPVCFCVHLTLRQSVL